MPLYFFDLVDHKTFRDDEGTELANDKKARVEAVVFGGRFLAEHPEVIWNGHEIRVHVFRHDRTPIFVVLVISIELDRPRSDSVTDGVADARPSA